MGDVQSDGHRYIPAESAWLLLITDCKVKKCDAWHPWGSPRLLVALQIVGTNDESQRL
jgi:hypothetical protein